MRIGFDVSQTGAGRTGCGWYAHQLLEALAQESRDDELVLYPTFGDLYWSPAGGRDTVLPRRANVRRGPRHRTFESMQEFWRHPPADWERKLGRPDLVHSNNYYCPVGLRQARLVYTLYDLGFLEEPDWSSEANRVGCFAGVFDASLVADLIIAISDFSRSHFLRHFPHFPADRIVVVHPGNRFATDGATPAAPLPRLPPGKFWLHVGTNEPRKNLDHLLGAYAMLRAERQPALPLVLAGATGWLSEALPSRGAALGIADDLVVLGYVDDGQLKWLYENCFAFVFPSHFEGFGMPVLEAMGNGAPVIAAATTSIPEITGDCAELIDPRDPSTTARAMQELIDDPRRRAALSERGKERALRFSWPAAARRTLDAYREVLRRPRRCDEKQPPQS